MSRRGVIVGDQMQCFLLVRFAFNLIQKLQPFRVAMPPLTLRDDLAVEHVGRIGTAMCGQFRQPLYIYLLVWCAAWQIAFDADKFLFGITISPA